MQKIIILLLIIHFSIFSFAQSTNDLDIKNGFKHFVFGMSSSQIQNIIRDNEQASKNSYVKEYYYYPNNDIQTIFNVEINSISLSFFKDKLFSIRISFDNDDNPFSKKDFNNIQYALEQTYGKDWGNAIDGGIITNGSIWKGSKVTLELIRLDYSNDTPEPIDFVTGYIHIFDNELMKKMYQSDF